MNFMNYYKFHKFFSRFPSPFSGLHAPRPLLLACAIFPHEMRYVDKKFYNFIVLKITHKLIDKPIKFT